MAEREGERKYRAWWVGGWAWPVATAVGTIIWVALVYILIGSRPVTTWQYGTAPYVPGSSPYAIEPVPKGAPPSQVVLPTGQTTGIPGTSPSQVTSGR